MIPKVIHYCWFGGGEQPDNAKDCIESWKKTNPEFEIKLWNELNFPFEKYPFMSRMYNEKRYAFVVDHARLAILKDEGGIFLDIDMFLLQPLEPLTWHECVIGEESDGMLNAAMIGARAGHPFIQKCLDFYDSNPEQIIPIPKIVTQVFANYSEKDKVKVFPPQTFYPIDAEHISSFHGQDLGPDVIGVHLWNYSWGHPLNKFFKKIGIYYIGRRIVNKLGIKSFLKRIFRFI